MSLQQPGPTESALEYRVFTAKRPGLTPGVPPGYESLMWAPIRRR
jgi:hypothetical protein